jgi:hypothetical protein
MFAISRKVTTEGSGGKQNLRYLVPAVPIRIRQVADISGVRGKDAKREFEKLSRRGLAPSQK